MNDIKYWMIVFGILFLFVAVMSAIFVVQRCGAQGLLYGNSAVLVAATVCDGE